MTDRDVFSMTHEDLDTLVRSLDVQLEELAAAVAGSRVALETRFEKLALRRGDVVAIQAPRELSIDERRILAGVLADFGEPLALRFLVLSPDLKARLARRCEVCGKANR